MHFHIDIFTNSSEISVNIQIADSQNTQIHFFQFCSSDIICLPFYFFIMSAAVKFNDQLRLRAIKVSDIISDCLLSLKTQRVIP